MEPLTSNLPSVQKVRKVHLNIPQLMYWLTQAALSVLIWGRATGKTNGPSAIFLAECMDNMPRSVIRLAAYTYEGLMKNILPGIIQGWEDKYGYVEGIHFSVGKPFPADRKVKKPYRAPRGSAKHTIYWYNGSVTLLSSMDRTVNNGTEFDAICIEEARLCKEEKVKELVLAKRGNVDKFGHLPWYGAVLLVTDRPRNQSGRWILDYLEEATPEINKMILKVWFYIGKLEAKLNEQIKAKHNAAAEKTSGLIKKFHKQIFELRKRAVYFSEASTLENIHALGVSTIKSFVKLLDKWEYDLSVLNKDSNKVINGFYSQLSNRHFHEATDYKAWGYDDYDQKHLNTPKKNCIIDSDCNLDAPLHIAFDTNKAINNVVVGQHKGDTIYVSNHMFVLEPHYLPKLCEKFCEYYEPHHTKRVVFHYNQTMIPEGAQGQESDADLIIRLLTEKGFSIERNYTGAAPKHYHLYSLWHRTLVGKDPKMLKISFNASNCHYLRISMDNADIKIREGKYFKNKDSERKDYKTQSYMVPPEEATHASEAADSLLVGMQLQASGKTTYDAMEVFIG